MLNDDKDDYVSKELHGLDARRISGNVAYVSRFLAGLADSFNKDYLDYMPKHP